VKNETTNLAEDEVVGAEDLPVGLRAHRVHGSGLEVEEHGARDVATWGGKNESFFFFLQGKGMRERKRELSLGVAASKNLEEGEKELRARARAFAAFAFSSFFFPSHAACRAHADRAEDKREETASFSLLEQSSSTQRRIASCCSSSRGRENEKNSLPKIETVFSSLSFFSPTHRRSLR